MNTFLWVFYSFAIMDFSTGITDATVLIIDAVSLARLRAGEKKQAAEE